MMYKLLPRFAFFTLAMFDAMTPDQRIATIELAGGMFLVGALVLTLVEVVRRMTRPTAAKPATEAEWLGVEHGNGND